MSDTTQPDELTAAPEAKKPGVIVGIAQDDFGAAFIAIKLGDEVRALTIVEARAMGVLLFEHAQMLEDSQTGRKAKPRLVIAK